MSDLGKDKVEDATELVSDKPQSVSRRAVLKGTAAAMPAVLTLQSGAALARSSNLIGAANSPRRDRSGRTLCLDVNSVYPSGRSGRVFDMGRNPRATVYAINERDYRMYPRMNAPRISEARACLEERVVYYVDENDSWESTWEARERDDGKEYGDSDAKHFVFRRNWQQARIPRGAFVSATALSSFAGNVIVRDI